MTQECRLHGEVALNVSGSLRLFQITDTHLMGEPGGRLLNVDTDDSLEAVVALAKTNQPAPNALLITGDISGDGSGNAYNRLDQALAPLSAPSFWLPGNHDGCSSADVPSERFTRQLLTPHWCVVMLNSQIDDAVGGHLASTQISALANAVDHANATGRHLLVALHHPLFPLGCDWLDPQRVDNADAFFAEVSRCQQSVVVISGHVHQASDQITDGIRYLTTPSTCIQFAPKQVDFKVDDLPPGYRWLELHPDGSIDTAVERVQGRQFTADLDSNGYL